MLGSLLRRQPEQRSGQVPAGWIQMVTDDGPVTWAGAPVTTDAALRHSAVWACAHRIATDVSMLPVDVVRRVGDVRVPVEPAPPVVSKPSRAVSAPDWRYQVLMAWLLRGNAYGEVLEVDRGGFPTSIEVMHPDLVRPQVVAGELVFYVNNEPVELWPVGPLWHHPAFLMPGSIVGLSPITYAAQSIGQGLAAEKYGSLFYAAGGHPTAMIRSARDIDQPTADRIKAAWRRATSNSREPVVMGSDLEYEAIQVAPEDAAFVEAQRWSVEQVCRAFGIPPEMIGAASSGSSVTYANREQRAIDYTTFTLGGWLSRMETALSLLLPRQQEVKIQTAALLKTDVKTRAEVHTMALDGGWRSVNEVRALEDEGPIPSGDVYKPLDEGGQMSARELAESLQKIYLSVDKVITSDEAREILNRDGAGLSLPGPEFSDVDEAEPDADDELEEPMRAQFVELRAEEPAPMVVAPNVHVHMPEQTHHHEAPHA